MRSTGIIRRIDDLGRVVIPKEIRRNLHLHEGDALELFVERNAVCFTKYYPMEGASETIRDVQDLIRNDIRESYHTPAHDAVLQEADKLLQEAYEKLRQAEKMRL